MPSYQINIQRDEIFIENESELSHNSLKLLHLTLENGGEAAHVRNTPGRGPFVISSVMHFCITEISQFLRQREAKCTNYETTL